MHRHISASLDPMPNENNNGEAAVAVVVMPPDGTMSPGSKTVVASVAPRQPNGRGTSLPPLSAVGAVGAVNGEMPVSPAAPPAPQPASPPQGAATSPRQPLSAGGLVHMASCHP